MDTKLANAAKEYSDKFKTQVSTEGLENIVSDFSAGAEWQKKQDLNIDDSDGEIVIIKGTLKVTNTGKMLKEGLCRLVLSTPAMDVILTEGSLMHCSDIQDEIKASFD